MFNTTKDSYSKEQAMLEEQKQWDDSAHGTFQGIAYHWMAQCWSTSKGRWLTTVKQIPFHYGFFVSFLFSRQMLFLLLVKSSFGANRNRAQCCLFPLLHSSRTSFSNPLQEGSMFWCFNLCTNCTSQANAKIQLRSSLAFVSQVQITNYILRKKRVAHKICVTKLCKPQFQTHVLSMSCHNLGLM